MANNFSKYGTGIYPRPNDDIDPKHKDELWHKNWCEYIFGYGMRSTNSSPYARRDNIRLNRQYANGEQDTDQYLSRVTSNTGNNQGNPVGQTDVEKQGKSARRQGRMNIDPEILPVFPKYLSLLIGKYAGMEHDITAEACDLKSGADRENLKWNTWFESKQRDVIDNFYASIGSEPQLESTFIPESIEEMEFFDAMGGFKLKHETAMEILTQHGFDISDWSINVKRNLVSDLIVNNFAAAQDYLDVDINKVKTKYVDIENLITPYCTPNKYTNPDFWGYVKLCRAADLRVHGISEERIKGYAENVAGSYGNISWDSVASYEQNWTSGAHGYDDFLIPVLEAEWTSVDTFYDQVRISSNGTKVIKQEYFDTGKARFNNKNYENRKDRSIDKTDVKNVYKCSWVIGSDDIFSYGRVYDTVRKDNEARTSMHIFRLEGKSILERCIRNLNLIQIGWLKFQNAVAKAAPPGIAVEFDAISNISTGMDGENFHPLEVLQILTETGNLIYKVTPMGFGGMQRGNAGKPIEHLPGGMGTALKEFNDLFATQIATIQQNTGLAASADASNPDPNQSVRGSELALAATNNTLRSLYDGYIAIKSKIADSFTYKIQLLIQDDTKVYEAYYPVLGKAKLKTLEIAENLRASSFGIKIEARPTEEMKAEIKEQIRIGMNSGREGVPSLRSSQGIMLINMLENGVSLKLVSSLLQYYERKEQERQERVRQASITEQGEQKRLSDQQASELKQQEKQADHERAKELKIIEGEQDRQTEMQKHKNKMKELTLVEAVRLGDNLPESV